MTKFYQFSLIFSYSFMDISSDDEDEMEPHGLRHSKASHDYLDCMNDNACSSNDTGFCESLKTTDWLSDREDIPDDPDEDMSMKFVEDLEPNDTKSYEFAYQPWKLIRNYFIGPSHWKFLNVKIAGNKKIRKKKKRSRKLTLKDLSEPAFNNNSLLVHAKQLKKTALQDETFRRWSRGATKTKDFHVSPDMFDSYAHASFKIDEKIADYIPESQHDEMMYDEIEFPLEAITQAETTQKITKTSEWTQSLNFSRRVRNINIKSIRQLSLTVIETESQAGKFDVSFSEVHKKVEKMFQELDEDTSCSLTFFR